MAAAMQYLDRICTYDPLLITSFFNSGELVVSTAAFRARQAWRTSGTA